jgi:hypothetical protein
MKDAPRKIAQPRSGRATRILAGGALVALTLGVACAPRPAPEAKRGLEIDAAISSRSGWTVFRLGEQRYARLPATGEAWADTGLSNRAAWRAIPSPDGVFRPVAVLAGARGYLYVVDAGSNRLCLYDSAFGLISTYPLPERFTPFPSGRAAVFRGVDGGFLFADYATGEAFLYSDREGTEGGRVWGLRARAKMPVGWRDCVQRPGGTSVSCRAGGGVVRYDGALNRIPAGGAAVRDEDGSVSAVPGEPASRLFWNPETREWVVEGQSFDHSPLFHFYPTHRRLERVVPQ